MTLASSDDTSPYLRMTQIALKVFLNMRLNRRDILREIKRTQLVLSAQG